MQFPVLLCPRNPVVSANELSAGAHPFFAGKRWYNA